MISAQQLEALLFSHQHLEQQMVLSLPARAETWRHIYQNHPELAFVLAQNPSLPEDLSSELAAHPKPSVRLMVARRGNPGFEALQNLASDEEAAIRLAVAKRDDLDQLLVLQLLNDADEAVREAAERYQHHPLAMVSGW